MGKLLEQVSCSWLRIGAPNPFHRPCSPAVTSTTSRTNTPTEDLSITIPNIHDESVSHIFILCWAILLAEYQGSTSIDISARPIGAQYSIPRDYPLQMNIAPDSLIADSLQTVSHMQRMMNEKTLNDHSSPILQDTWVSMRVPSDFSDLLSGKNDSIDDIDELAEGEVLQLVASQRLGSQIVFRLQYSTAYVEPQAARRLLHQLGDLSRQILMQSPDERASKTISHLDTITELDREAIISWNSPVFPLIADCLHRRVAAQAREIPSAPAVSAWDGDFSYAELDQLSRRVAHLLRQNGVTKGSMVPILLEKSKWMVVSVLGVYHAGAAAVTVCTSHPDAYVSKIIEQTAAPCILTSHSQAPRLQDQSSPVLIMPDAMYEMVSTRDDSLDVAEVHPEDLAVVIFTSGSTGTPKGVLLTHQAIATSTTYHGHAVGAIPQTRILQFSSYAFDMSVIETWYALAHGGCLCVPSETQRLESLPSFIRQHEASWAFFTPSLLRTYKPGELPLKTIVLGGENVPADLVQQWHPHTRLFDLWGPAETAGAGGCAIHPDRWIPGTFGRGAGCRLWISRPDDPNRLAALGAVGEVLIEGEIVAQGYLNDPERTSQAMIAPPAWRASFPFPVYGRFFRTGDLVQYNPDGSVRYVARRDTMVKVQGQRVDLDSIEATIRRYQQGKAVAVEALPLPARLGRCDPVVIAFVETAYGAELKASGIGPIQDVVQCRQAATDLQAHLTDALPRFMVPSFVVPLTALPLGPTGKVDKKRLRGSMAQQSPAALVAWLQGRSTLAPPSLTNPAQSTPRASPTAPTASNPPPPQESEESQLVALVASVLGIDASLIDRHTPFRQLGGDSVSAIRLMRLLAEHGKTVPRTDLLRANWTLGELVGELRPTSQKNSDVPAPFSLLPSSGRDVLLDFAAKQCQLDPKEIEDMYPCTPLQEALLAITTGRADGAYVDSFIFSPLSPESLNTLRNSWDRLVEEVPILRTRLVQNDTGQLFQVVVRATERLPWTKETSTDAFLDRDATSEMTFGHSLLRMSTIDSAGGSCVAIALHHAIYDGWTWSLLLRRLEHMVHDLPQADKLGPFSSFVHHLRNSVDRTEAESFWRQKLADVAPITYPEYPSLDYTPRTTTTIKLEIPGPPPTAEASPSAQIQLAWAQLLAAYSNSSDVVFGSVRSGRERQLSGVATTAGPTIATVPVRIVIDPRQSIRNAWMQIEEEMTALQPFQHTGLQHIARLGPEAAVAGKLRSLLVVQADPEITVSPTLGTIRSHPGTAKGVPGWALALIVTPARSKWTLELLVDEALVSRKQAGRLTEQLRHLLLSGYDDPDMLLGEVDLLSPSDVMELNSWHKGAPKPVDADVAALIRFRAAQAPNAMAVDAWDGTLTYAELEQNARALAVQLPDTGTLAFCFGRSRWVPVAMLAALQAGRPFVMLDPEQPVSQREQMCSRVKAVLVLTDASTPKFAQGLGPKVLLMENGRVLSAPVACSRSSLCRSSQKSEIAYIVFTSGSTGNPKAVVIEQRQFAAAAIAQQEKLAISTESRVLHLSSYAFDSFAVEILTTLTAGACVCIPTDHDSRHEIAAAAKQFRATWLVLTPSLLRLLEGISLPSLRTLVAVGESLQPSQASWWAQRVQLLCGYGPTECCTGASAQPINAESPDVRNIGAGMGCRFSLIDYDNPRRLMPIGSVGEIVIKGPIVGRCYLDDPERSNPVFLDSAPWDTSAASSTRLYRTGDLGRYNDDGTVTFLGRRGPETKLRGQRLDLHAVEQRLQQAWPTPATILASVVRPQEPNSNPMLVAMVAQHQDQSTPNSDNIFCVPDPEVKQVARVVQANLHAQGPSIMVPALFIQLASFPLTTSGKFDRSAVLRAAASLGSKELHRLGSIGVSEQDCPILNAGETVAIELTQWLEEIHVQHSLGPIDRPIRGRDVRPVQLGVDSIRMIAFASQISRHYGVRIPVTVLFQATLTVRQIAAMIEAGGTIPDAGDSTTVPDWWKDYQRLSAHIDQLPRSGNQNTVSCRQELTAGRRVFLTGATGFLGSRILQQLVTTADVELVTVLVRAPSEGEALARLVSSARRGQWWRDEYRRIIKVWRGDLSQPQLGLSDAQWAHLSHGDFDSIIHNGAMVHWVYPYSTLQPANVQSTVELLSAIAQAPGTPIQFTYVSALRPGEAVLSDVETLAASEADASDEDGGYAQTKAVSELLLHRYAQGRDCRIAIVRPGLMIGPSVDGAPNADDVLWRTVAAAVAVGGFNGSEAAMSSWVYLAPVDWVATAVIAETLHSPTDRAALALTTIDDGLLAHEFWRAISQATGLARPLVSLSDVEWLDRVHAQLQTQRERHPLWPVWDFVRATGGALGHPQAVEASVYHAGRSVLWMTLLRNAQYLLSLGIGETDLLASYGKDILFSRNPGLGNMALV
jgi:amino acid adenylation domain-containing protein/thioester reductase-like protein